MISKEEVNSCIVEFGQIVDGEFVKADIWSVTLAFQDILGNEYTQEFIWEMEGKFADARRMPIAKCHSNPPVYNDKLKH